MILALDLASVTGVAVGMPRSAPTSWSVDLGKARTEDARFSRVLVLTSTLIDRHKPTLIAVEAAVGGPKASAYLIGLVACLRGVAFTRGVPVRVFTSQSVRKHFLGRAPVKADFPGLSIHAQKRAIKSQVMRRCGLLGWPVEDDNAADACALWDYACAVDGHQTRPLGELFRGKP